MLRWDSFYLSVLMKEPRQWRMIKYEIDLNTYVLFFDSRLHLFVTLVSNPTARTEMILLLYLLLKIILK